MEHEMQPYGVHVQTDGEGRIIAVNSDAFIPYLDGWVKIDEGYGDKYHHAQGNYFPLHIRDERGICRYKLVDGIPEARTGKEMDADYVEPEPVQSDTERINELEAALEALIGGIADA